MAVGSGRESGDQAGRVRVRQREWGSGRESGGQAGRVGSWHPGKAALSVVGAQGSQEGCLALLTAAMVCMSVSHKIHTLKLNPHYDSIRRWSRGSFGK